MNEIDAVIDVKPTKSRVKELAGTRINNLLCFQELESLNDTGKFKYKHPLIKNYSERVKLEKLSNENPELFLNEYANTRDNVKRYNSFLKSKTRPPEQKEKDKINLEKHREREQLFIDITKQNNANNS